MLIIHGAVFMQVLETGDVFMQVTHAQHAQHSHLPTQPQLFMMPGTNAPPPHPIQGHPMQCKISHSYLTTLFGHLFLKTTCLSFLSFFVVELEELMFFIVMLLNYLCLSSSNEFNYLNRISYGIVILVVSGQPGMVAQQTPINVSSANVASQVQFVSPQNSE